MLYQEGRIHVSARFRLRGLLLGMDGPDFVMGSAVTTGVLQTQLSKKLQPPVKWSYLRLVGWFGLGSLATLVAYGQSVLSDSTEASSLPDAIFVLSASSLFFFFGYVFWQHNRLVYPRERAQWERSFFCQRCGGESQHAVGLLNE